MPTAREMADSIAAQMEGPDLVVHGARSLTTAERGTIVFLNRQDDQGMSKISSIGEIVCVTTPNLAKDLTCTRILHDRPRLAFCMILANYFATAQEHLVSPVSVVAPEAEIGAGVAIGAGSIIGPAARIGAGTRIGAGVVVTGSVEIGEGCIVKSNTSIGESGFGFAFHENGEPFAFPHIGGVKIGNAVEIGPNCNIARAALDDTIIGDFVKMNSLVHVAHNVSVGPRTLIAAGALICGSVSIGKDVWIGAGATIIDQISVGDRAHVGIGSVVVRSLDPGVKVLGNPARKIPSMKKSVPRSSSS